MNSETVPKIYGLKNVNEKFHENNNLLTSFMLNNNTSFYIINYQNNIKECTRCILDEKFTYLLSFDKICKMVNQDVLDIINVFIQNPINYLKIYYISYMSYIIIYREEGKFLLVSRDSVISEYLDLNTTMDFACGDYNTEIVIYDNGDLFIYNNGDNISTILFSCNNPSIYLFEQDNYIDVINEFFDDMKQKEKQKIKAYYDKNKDTYEFLEKYEDDIKMEYDEIDYQCCIDGLDNYEEEFDTFMKNFGISNFIKHDSIIYHDSNINI